jgi:tyrosine-protein kinase Etk/Wzc
MDEETPPKQHDGDQAGLLDIALLLAQNLRLLVLLPLAVGAIAVGLTFLIAPTFTATARLLPPQQQQSGAALLASQFGALAGMAGAAAGIKNPTDTYVAMIKSRTVADKLLARFRLRELYKRQYDDDARMELANRTKVTAGRDGLIAVEVSDHDPKRAAELANAYVEELRALTQRLAVSEAGQRRLFFENQLKQAKDELTNAEIALSGSGISEATLKTMPASALESLARLKAQITAQEVKIASMRGYMTESNPQLKQAQQELSALRAQLAKSEQMDSVSATGSGAEYVAKFRNFKYYETLFELMAKQYEMARLDEAREGAVIQIVDPALPPERKSSPNRGFTGIFTTFLTLFLVVFALFARHMVRRTASEPASARKLEQLWLLLRFRKA